MAPNLKGPVRRKKAGQAYDLSITRVPYAEIARQLEISRQLVSTLCQEEQERRGEERDDSERDQAIATYEAVMRKAWEELASQKLAAGSLNRSGFLNTVINAQKAIDEITGVKSAKKYEVLLAEGLEAMLGTLEEGLDPHEFRRVAGLLARAYSH